jgi:hypothetical protein
VLISLVSNFAAPCARGRFCNQERVPEGARLCQRTHLHRSRLRGELGKRLTTPCPCDRDPQDKKNRLYIITALSTTPIDLVCE